MAASAAKMGLHRSPTTLPAPFSCLLALESLAKPRDEIIFKQALRLNYELWVGDQIKDILILHIHSSIENVQE